MNITFKLRLLITLVLIFTIAGCSESKQSQTDTKVKNIILLIGDGMGTSQVDQAIQYRRLIKPNEKPLNFEMLFKDYPLGLVETHSANGIVTDSAAAATAMACGFKTNGEMVGQTPEGKKCKSILHLAKDVGLSTGLVSNTRISHATPSPFAAQNIYRYNEDQLSEQIISEGKVDVLLNGGGRFLIPEFKGDGKTQMRWSDLEECQGIPEMIDGKSKRHDQKDLVAVAKKMGYQFACKAEQLSKIKDQSKKILGVFTGSAMPHIQQRSQIKEIPSLKTMSQTALEVLSQNQKGFFLMIESGLIDYAGHDNDASTQLKETLDFDETIGLVLDFAKKNPDTLVLITADHETGGFGYSYRILNKEEQQLPEHTRIPEGSRSSYRFGPPKEVYKKLVEQKIPLRDVLQPILFKVFASDDDVNPISKKTFQDGVKELIEQSKIQLGYNLKPSEATYIIKRTPEDYRKDFEVHHTPFNGNYTIAAHMCRFGEVIAPYNFATWGTGNHTALPVAIFAAGPQKHASKIQGMIDNTDIFKIMKAALEDR